MVKDYLIDLIAERFTVDENGNEISREIKKVCLQHLKASVKMSSFKLRKVD